MHLLQLTRMSHAVLSLQCRAHNNNILGQVPPARILSSQQCEHVAEGLLFPTSCCLFLSVYTAANFGGLNQIMAAPLTSDAAASTHFNVQMYSA